MYDSYIKIVDEQMKNIPNNKAMTKVGGGESMQVVAPPGTTP